MIAGGPRVFARLSGIGDLSWEIIEVTRGFDSRYPLHKKLWRQSESFVSASIEALYHLFVLAVIATASASAASSGLGILGRLRSVATIFCMASLGALPSPVSAFLI